MPTPAGLSVGIDLVEVSTVADSLAAHGQRYLERVYTPREIEDCGGATPNPQRLAARFAAKEATYKALGLSEPFRPLDVEVGQTSTGAPTLALHGQLATAWQAQGAAPLALSLTHEAGVACAVVIAYAPVTA